MPCPLINKDTSLSRFSRSFIGSAAVGQAGQAWRGRVEWNVMGGLGLGKVGWGKMFVTSLSGFSCVFIEFY